MASPQGKVNGRNPGKVPYVLPGVKSPQDLKNLGISELNRLATEIRELIISTVVRNGGHLSSNLGVVELTIALHLVFNSPDDKIVWDVGHQCYTHKILTGRYGQFTSLRKSGGIAGFPKMSESPHDSFNTGHASTSISAALGMLAAEKILGSGKRSVAVIGDGALTGGLAFEALSHAGHLDLPIVIILNDNKMSISPNVGGISKHLSGLSMKSKYQTFRRTIDSMVRKIPLIGEFLFMMMVRFKRAVKAVFYVDNFFVDLGFEYAGPIDGHNLPQLIQVIRNARDLNKPVVVHVTTWKGKGYASAEEDPGSYHAVSSRERIPPGRTFTNAFSDAVLEAGKADERLAVITAAMEDGTGLSAFRTAFPGRFYDVGIAEEHAVTFAAGLASRGLRPVTAIYSSFFQRALDQVVHDVCLQNLPVIFVLDRAGLVSDDGETHQGILDISLFRSAPGLTILAPAGEEELKLMLNWVLEKSAPVMIRYAKTSCPSGVPAFSFPVEEGRGVFIKSEREDPARLCILFTGSLFTQVMEVKETLEAKGIAADLYNLRFLKPVDEDHLAGILNSYEAVITAEEGILAGGFGEHVSDLALRRKCTARIFNLGVKEKFDALGTREELLERNGLDGESIALAAVNLLMGHEFNPRPTTHK